MILLPVFTVILSIFTVLFSLNFVDKHYLITFLYVFHENPVAFFGYSHMLLLKNQLETITLLHSCFLINLRIELKSSSQQLEDCEDLFAASSTNMKNYKLHHILKIFLYLSFVDNIIGKNYL